MHVEQERCGLTVRGHLQQSYTVSSGRVSLRYNYWHNFERLQAQLRFDSFQSSALECADPQTAVSQSKRSAYAENRESFAHVVGKLWSFAGRTHQLKPEHQSSNGKPRTKRKPIKIFLSLSRGKLSVIFLIFFFCFCWKVIITSKSFRPLFPKGT